MQRGGLRQRPRRRKAGRWPRSPGPQSPEAPPLSRWPAQQARPGSPVRRLWKHRGEVLESQQRTKAHAPLRLSDCVSRLQGGSLQTSACLSECVARSTIWSSNDCTCVYDCTGSRMCSKQATDVKAPPISNTCNMVEARSG